MVCELPLNKTNPQTKKGNERMNGEEECSLRPRARAGVFRESRQGSKDR